ncbi:MAG: TetR/AcrR family transcriptional regulator [Lachnospiraceae bacterium]|nr:TetR/AcrR family transcriptional regulator [Lachnospiraceae bacterium]
MRKKHITKEMLCEAAIELVAKNGLENFTTKKVAVKMGISEGSIFNNYPNKIALLTDCLYAIDHEIDSVLKSVPLRITALTSYVHDLWYAYFGYLLANPNKAKFYLSFRHSSYYTKEVIKGQDTSFSFFSMLLKNHVEIFKISSDIFWVYMIETTLNFAVRMADGNLEPTELSVNSVYQLLIHGIAGIYKKK